MRKSRLAEEQMVNMLREAGRSPVVEVANKHRVGEQTRCLWRQRYGQFEVADVKQLRALQQENSRRKKLVAERDREIGVVKEVTAKRGERADVARTGQRIRRSRPQCAARLGAMGCVTSTGIRDGLVALHRDFRGRRQERSEKIINGILQARRVRHPSGLGSAASALTCLIRERAILGVRNR